MKKIYYSIEFNTSNKMWCLFKNIEGEQSYNFYQIVESDRKIDCIQKLEEINKEINNEKRDKNIERPKN